MKLVGKAILVLITVAMAVTMSFLVVIPNGTAKAQDSTCTVNSTGDAIDQSHPAQIAYSGDDIVVTMSLVSISDQLTFNQSHVEDNRLEYSWGVRIDTDGNVSTGDGAGYDVEILLTHFKPPGNSPFTGTILDGTQKNTWVLSGSSYLFAHNIEAEMDHDTKSIIMIAKQSWEEFADFDINDRFCCKTYYYSPSGSVQDITSDNPPGSNIVSDPEGDVSYSFVDITGGKVQLPDTIQPSVSLTNHLISHTADYSVTFTIAEDVTEGEYIIITFPDDTGITNVDATDCTIAATSGIGSDAFVATTATSISKSGRELTITVPDVNAQDKIGTGATVEVIANDVLNPSFPGDYTLTVATSGETTPVESASYAIETPTIPPVPGIVQLYNPVDILMAQYTGDDAIQRAIDDAWAGWTVKVYTGTYTTNVDVNVDHLTIQSENGPEVTTVRAANSNDHVFEVTADNVTISGFSIFGATGGFFKAGIYLASNTHHSTISNNRCGYDGDHKNYIGIYLDGSSTNTISANTCNSNLSFGIDLQESSNNTISGNTCNDNSVGGIGLMMPSENNTLSGNTCNSNSYHGIRLYNSSNNTISGNICNSNLALGIYLQESSNNTITSNTTNDNNYGIYLSSSSSNAISGNICNSNLALGIYLQESSNNTIGGTTASVGNTIAFNGGDGVVVEVGIGNAIQSNSIFSNAGLGIDLGADGMTLNDPGDTDSGANNLQNFPVLTSATSGSTTIEGTLNSTPNTKFRLEFFANTECDPSGYGEGETFLGFIDVTTDGGGNVAFTVTFPDTVPGGHFITATATDPGGNTSEFSQCVQVIALEPDIRTPIDPIDFGDVEVGSSLDETTTLYNDGTATLTINTITRLSGSDEFTYVGPPTPFDIAAGGSQVITIRFAPTSAGLKSATFNINSNDPDEGLVEVALSGSAMQIAPATVDFAPDTLNLKSKGKVVTVYIELPEGYDVEEIDISTVMLNGIVPALAHPTDVGDYDSDGVPDLMVKFDRSDVQDVLEPGNEVEVTASGQLTDGTSFEGTDTIRVIAKGKK